MRSVVRPLALVVTLILAGGAGYPSAGPAADYPMVLGDPYVIDGVTYTPADTLNYDAVGQAVKDDGVGVSGAHRTLPVPSYVEVTALDSGHTVLVRIDRRGPLSGPGLVELSSQAWAQLGLSGQSASVRVRRVNPPEQERALLRAGKEAPRRMDTPPGLLGALNRKLATGTAKPTVLTPPPASAAVAAPLAVSGPVAKAQAPVPSPSPPPAKADASAYMAKPVPAPKPVPVARPVAEKPPVAARPAPEAKPPVHGAAVQVGAYGTRTRADAAARAVGGSVSAAGKLWRVRMGPFADGDAAVAALAKARRAGYAEARILHVP